MAYPLAFILLFVTGSMAGLVLGLPHLVDLTARLLAWCRSIMLLCVPYASVIKAGFLWSGTLIVGGGVLYALFKGAAGLVRARMALRRLPLVDRGLGVSLIKDDNLKVAFTHGLLRPRIYLSTGLIKGLSRDELRAVLLHEAHHRRYRDPLRFFFMSFLRDLVFYLPVAGWFASEFMERKEKAADDSVVSRTGDTLGLASALLKVARATPVEITALSASIKGKGSGSIEDRIRRLVDDEECKHKSGSRPVSARLVASSVAIAILLLLSVSLPIFASGTPGKGDCNNMASCSMASGAVEKQAGSCCTGRCGK